jgi:hypothetical protein
VTVSDTALALANVVYGIPSSTSLSLTNTGAVAATWRFVPKPEDKTYGRTWLTLDPPYGMLVPGQTATVSVTVTVDDAVARDISLGREMAVHTPGTLVAATLAAQAAAGSSGRPQSSSSSTSQATSSMLAATAASPAPLAHAGGLLEDILILRLERGRDFYVSVSAAVLPTCFGSSLEQLARRPEPMRALALTAAAGAAANAAAGTPVGGVPAATQAAIAAAASGGAAPGGGGGANGGGAVVDLAAGSAALAALLARDDADEEDGGAANGGGDAPLLGDLLMAAAPAPAPSASSPAPSPVALPSSDASKRGTTLLSVPKEVWRLVDALWTRGLGATRGLFTAPTADPGAVAEIRECLDTGDPLPAGVDPLALAQALLDLLSSLREPVVPTSLFPGPDFRALPLEAWVAHMLRSLSPLHYNVLLYVVRFAREVLASSAGSGSSSGNGASLDDLALVFSRALMRKWSHEEAPAHLPLPGGASASSNGGAGGARGGGRRPRRRRGGGRV